MVKIIEPSFKILTDIEALNPLKMIEIAARTCYQSWDYMQEGSAEKLIKHILYDYPIKHWAMIEHGGMVSVRFIANRGMSHEAIRHRLTSFATKLISAAQISTRYVDYSKGKYNREITVIKPTWTPYNLITCEEMMKFAKECGRGYSNLLMEEFKDFVPEHQLCFADFDDLNKLYVWCLGKISGETSYFMSRDVGLKPQFARDDLPIGVMTEIVISANLTEWYHIFKLRTASAAHPLIRILMRGLLKEFKVKIPIIFDDLPNYDEKDD